MSEPLSSHEIEDVLSSIRRLVSEDLRPAARAAAAAAPAERPDRAAADKLLLTPSLRVVPDVVPVAEPAPEPEPEPAPAAGVEVVEIAESRIEEAAASAPLPVEPAPEAGDPVEFAEMEDVVWASAGVPDDAVEDDPEPVTAEDVVAVRGHWTAETVPVPEMDWMQAEADWVEEDPLPLPFTTHRRAAGRTTEEPLARAWAERAEAEVRAELQGAAVPPVAEVDMTPPPFARARKVEVPQDDFDDVPEVDDVGSGSGGSGSGGSGSGGSGGSGSGDGGSGPGGPGLFDADDPVLDEEMLREIVRDIIREELAGTLGERITRNVRKLVRVEINRALAAREFE